jgi:dipeptide ABC superfamily ATP binding cassette transporter, membrane protein
MLKFFAKRILESVVILFGVILITFLLMNIIPGNAATVLMGQKPNEQAYDRIVKKLELDKPVGERFVKYISDLSRGDLGTSIIMNRKVADIIKNSFPATMILTLSSLTFAWIFGIILGILSALHNGKFVDRLIMGTAILGISMPSFWIAIIFQYVFAYKLKLVPISGFGKPIQLILPSIVLGITMAGSIARLLRANLLEVLGMDFLDLAKTKGAKKYRLLFLHALKSSLLPVITIMIMQLTSLFGGAMITESIFGIPGLGTLSISALTNRDLPVLQGIILFGTVITILGNLLADIIYTILDPRIRLK